MDNWRIRHMMKTPVSLAGIRNRVVGKRRISKTTPTPLSDVTISATSCRNHWCLSTTLFLSLLKKWRLTKFSQQRTDLTCSCLLADISDVAAITFRLFLTLTLLSMAVWLQPYVSPSALSSLSACCTNRFKDSRLRSLLFSASVKHKNHMHNVNRTSVRVILLQLYPIGIPA